VIATIVVLIFAMFQAAQPQATAPAPPPKSTTATTEPADVRHKLLDVKRIYVDSFGEDEVSKQIQGMVVSALAVSKKFVVTENKEKADAILRGSGLEKTSQEFHALNDKAAAASAAGGHSGSMSGSWSNGTGSVSGHSSGGFIAKSVASDDSKASTETIDHARLAVRLVSADGDVIWATTQESRGAKYKGASADVADKIVKQLLRDVEKLNKPAATTSDK
jgi:curli biogenesis system outer membrane secretion channel CsgG